MSIFDKSNDRTSDDLVANIRDKATAYKDKITASQNIAEDEFEARREEAAEARRERRKETVRKGKEQLGNFFKSAGKRIADDVMKAAEDSFAQPNAGSPATPAARSNSNRPKPASRPANRLANRNSANRSSNQFRSNNGRRR